MDRGRVLASLGSVVVLGFAVSACTSVNADTLKQRRAAGVTRSFDRPADDLYAASLVALKAMQSTSDWHELTIAEEDRVHGTIVAERRLDSAILPGVGMRDAIGIFVTPRSQEESDVTVVAVSSDQLPGEAGTSLQSRRAAQAYVFPGIEEALQHMREVARQPATPNAVISGTVGAGQSVTTNRAEESPRGAATGVKHQTEPTQLPHAEGSSLDRVYEILRSKGWRPLVREVPESGDELIRIGRWAKLAGTGARLVLTIREEPGVAVNAARLALQLEQAGFDVELREERQPDRAR